MTELDICRRQIKDWEKSFAAQSGHPPSKADIKANTSIRKAYKRYHYLKTKATKSTNTDKPKVDKEAIPDPVESPLTALNALSDDSDAEHLEPMHNAELGPTPQANGKVLSIFDMISSPPESSPLKRRQLLPFESVALSPIKAALHPKGDNAEKKEIFTSPSKNTNEDFEFKTPTKAVKELNFSNLTPSRSSASLSSRLKMVAQDSPQKATGSETPLYLGKVNSRFSFETSSPMKASGRINLTQEVDHPVRPSALLATPTKVATAFQLSPSPLKSQRILLLGSQKPVSTLLSELQNLAKNDAYEVQRLEMEEELRAQGEQVLQNKEPEEAQEENFFLKQKRKKAKTQKRTTRRHKMKPREDDTGEDTFKDKDVHEELQRLENFHSDQETSSDDTDSDDDNLPIGFSAKKVSSTKFQPVSNNFKRLKINDPRSKKFKQRMGRR